MKLEDIYFSEMQFSEFVNDSDASKKCAEIADNHAIGFAEWIDKYYYQNQNESNSFTECKEDIHNGKSFTINQLLEIYKETL